jgi:hypothetical protein
VPGVVEEGMPSFPSRVGRAVRLVQHARGSNVNTSFDGRSFHFCENTSLAPLASLRAINKTSLDEVLFSDIPSRLDSQWAHFCKSPVT